MHAEITASLARQHVAELQADAERRRQQRTHLGRRASVRTRIGSNLVRWGLRLDPPSRIVVHHQRPATMGP